MRDILLRLCESSTNESSHELQCRCMDAAAEITRLRTEASDAKRVLWAIGLSPPHHADILSAATGAARIVETLREMLADPPPDVQEAVMRKIGLKYMGDGIYRADWTPNAELSGRPLADVPA